MLAKVFYDGYFEGVKKSETQTENINATNPTQENQDDEIKKSYFWYLAIVI